MGIVTNYYKDGVLVRSIKKETILNEKIEKYTELLTKPTFNDMIYNDRVKEILRLIIKNSKDKPTNLLLYGGAGTGKTTTGKMIATELKKPFVYLNGEMSVIKIRNILTNLPDNTLVLFDEIHNMSERVSEIIYPAIQDGEIGLEGKIIRLNNVMFIGTTTEPERLPKPLRDRFKSIELEEFGIEELKLIYGKKVNEDCLMILLNFTTNIRVLNNLIDMIELYGEINLENIKKVFYLRNIDIVTGLTTSQKEYLEILRKSDKPVGLRLLCLKLNKSEDYIKLEVESELIKKDYVIITSRGREINPNNSYFLASPRGF